MHELLHQGLTVHTHICWKLHKGKRIYQDDKFADTEETWFEFEAWMNPPPLLLPPTWKRYQYTRNDVKTTYDKMDASFVWQMALMLMSGTYEPEAASAGVRHTFQSPFTFLFISRKTVMDAYLNQQQVFMTKSTRSALAHDRPEHRPLLPRVWVSYMTFVRFDRYVPSRPPSFRWRVTFPELFTWRGVDYVPIARDRPYLYMVRVVSETVFAKLPTSPRECVITRPVIVEVGLTNPQRYVLTDEACFVQAKLNEPDMEEENALPAIKKLLS